MKQAQRILALFLVAGTTAMVSGCTPRRKAPELSSAFSMNIAARQVRSEIRDPAALLQFMRQSGYYTTAIAAPGVRVFYSTSYETDQKQSAAAEAGRAHGDLRAARGGLYFNQIENVTTQALIPPGTASQFGEGLSRWKFDGPDGYAQLLLDVATNRRARRPGALHTGYERMEVAVVNFTGGTAGGQVEYADALEVSLVGGQSRTELYFAKGLGPVAMEFRENYMPAGTAKVYLQGGVPGGGGAQIGR